MKSRSPFPLIIRFISLVCPLLVLGIAIVALVGLSAGRPALVQIRPDYIPMAPNSAFCFIALALVLLPSPFSGRVYAGIVFSAILFVGLISIGRMSEYMLGLRLDVDHWFYTASTGTIGHIPIGYMAFFSAFCFALNALSIAFLNFPRAKLSAYAAGALAAAVMMIGGIFTLGYIYGAPLLYNGSAIPMALNTAVSFTLLGITATLLALNQELERHRKTDETQRLLAAMVASSEEAVIGRTPDGTIIIWNKGAEDLYGYTEDEIIGRHISILVPPERRVEVDRIRERLSRGEQVRGYETINVRKDGREFPVSLTISPVNDHSGRTVSVSVIARDISENKRKEVRLQNQVIKHGAALEESERRFMNLIHEAPDPMVTLSSLGFIELINREAERVTGYRKDELTGKHFSSIGILSGPSLALAFKEFMLVLAGRERPPYEMEMVTKDGRHVVYEANSRLIDQGGKGRGILVVFRSISERKKLEEQLTQAQKMEAVGLLAGGIAHDFNNHLSVILGTAEFISSYAGDNEQIRQDAEEIKKAANQSANLTRQLLAFSRRQVFEVKAMNINDVVTDTEKMLRRLIGEHIELMTKLQGDLPNVKVDPGQIEQVIINLVVNARDAMPKGGTLAIETDVDGGNGGPQVRLTVKDTGIGMDKSTVEHIFEPFFTTKEKGKGTGLGLSTVYGIIKQSGGHIDVDSKVGKGTAFHIYLPAVVEKETKPVDGAAAENGLLRGSETILLVEDEKSVRDVAIRSLSNYGYNVLAAQGAGEALLIYEKNGPAIRLIITDMVMPHMSGLELATRILGQNADTKILFMSGYADPDMYKSIVESGMPYIAKPVQAEALARKVREVLNQAPASKS